MWVIRYQKDVPFIQRFHKQTLGRFDTEAEALEAMATRKYSERLQVEER